MTREEEELLAKLGEMIEAEERRPEVVDEDKVKQVHSVKYALEEIVSGDCVNVSAKVHSPAKSMGFVRVTGEKIVITNYEAFALVSKLTSIVDVYPKVDGRVQMDFTFHGLTKKR